MGCAEYRQDLGVGYRHDMVNPRAAHRSQSPRCINMCLVKSNQVFFGSFGFRCERHMVATPVVSETIFFQCFLFVHECCPRIGERNAFENIW